MKGLGFVIHKIKSMKEFEQGKLFSFLKNWSFFLDPFSLSIKIDLKLLDLCQ